MTSNGGEVSNADLGDAMSDMAGVNAGLGDTMHELAGSMTDVARDLAELRVEMEEYRKAFESVDRKTTRALVAGVIVTMLLTISVATALIVNRSNASVIDQIKDCTGPPGECYDANQRRANERLGPLVALLCEAVPVDRRRPPCPPAR
jgi:hypothetical protein